MRTNEMPTIFFDMDGTIADLYGVEGWLDDIKNRSARPYEEARTLVRMNSLARVLNRLQRMGFRIAIVSWLAKNSTEEYDRMVTKAKKDWLKKHLTSVDFDDIIIVKYGTPKEQFARTNNDILFDDEKPNRDNWTGKAYKVEHIIEILKNLEKTT